MRHLFLCVVLFFTLCLPLLGNTAPKAPPLSGLDTSILPAPDAEGKWGYVDAVTGKTLIEPQYSAADFFYDGIAIVTRAYPEKAFDGRNPDGSTMRLIPRWMGLTDRQGREVLPAKYDVARANSNMFTPYTGVYIPRLFLVKGGKKESMVLHVDKGPIVPPGKYTSLRITEDGAVYCDGVYFTPEGGRYAAPAGYEVGLVDTQTKTFLVRRAGDHPSKSEGIMREDGSLLVPTKYVEVKSMPEVGVWLGVLVDPSVKSRVAEAYLGGNDMDIAEDQDILTVDVYDASGTVLRSFRARYAPNVHGDVYTYQGKGRKHRVRALTGEVLPKPAPPADATSGFRPFMEGDKFGIMAEDGAVSVPPVYGRLRSLGGELFAATKEDVTYRNNWGVIDSGGKEIVPFLYGSIGASGDPERATGALHCYSFSGGAGPTRHWLLDRTGRLITPQPYHSSITFNDAGQAVVWRDGKYGIIDQQGKEVLPMAYTNIFDEYSHAAEKTKKTRQGGEGAKQQTEPPAASAVLYRVERDKLWGLYDARGKERITVAYASLDVAGDWATVEIADPANPDLPRSERKQGLVNIHTGQVILAGGSRVKAYPGFFVAYGQENNKDVYLLLDKAGKTVGRYSRAEWFAEAGVLAVEQDGKYALVNKEGKQITPFRYAYVHKAEGPFVWGGYEGERTLRDTTGREHLVWGGAGVERVLVDGAGKEYRM